MTEILLTEEEEQAIQEGADAQALLDSPAFINCIEALRSQCAEAILTSDPEHGSQREAAYNLSRGLSAITVELIAISARAETVMDNATRPTTDEPIEPYGDDGQSGDY